MPVRPPPDLAARHAWQGAFIAAALNAVGMPIDFLLARGIVDMPFYPAAMSMLVGGGLMAFLLVRKSKATVRLGSVVFLLNTVEILVALWITSGYWATAHSWTPFQANKLGAMAVALLAPEPVVGFLAIAGFAAMAIGKFYVLDPEIQRRLPVGEPWFVLIFAMFAVVLLAYRLRSLAYERDVLRLHAEAEAAERTARTFLHLRDYANTPIQIILFATELMRARHPDLQSVLVRLERATKRLTELSRALNHYDSEHTWSPGDESLDARLVRQRQNASLDVLYKNLPGDK
jgi:hypothetical protein